ncbi:MAG: glycogen synthase [Spirochaetes bacterium]|nr:glycogen synthase [Spirochaetota bacterium]
MNDQQLHVVMLASECRNFAKVGGLGDVVWDLSLSLAQQGVKVSVILPYYQVIKKKFDKVADFKIEFGNRCWPTQLFYYHESLVDFFFIENEYFFTKHYTDIYIDSFKLGRGPFEDDAKRFAFFSTAALEILAQSSVIVDIDIIHCHDWHTGTFLLQLKLDQQFKELSSNVKTFFTIHNLDYQGVRPYQIKDNVFDLASFRQWFPNLFEQLKKEKLLVDYSNIFDIKTFPANEIEHNILPNLNPEQKNFFHSVYQKDEQNEFYYLVEKLNPQHVQFVYCALLEASFMCFNAMRACIRLADKVNTVSDTYAYEITLPDDPHRNFIGGRGLENDLKAVYKKGNLLGILNGLNYEIYDPNQLLFPYDSNQKNWLPKKLKNKEHFLLNLPQSLNAVYQKIGKKFYNYPQLKKKVKQIDFASWLDKPLVVSVGRAAAQKVGLLLEYIKPDVKIIEEILSLDIRMVFIATGELQEQLEIINHSEKALFISAFDHELGNATYTAGDIFLMPSYFEPCGISQMIAMRFGNLPLVNDIGGLHDTVCDFECGFRFTGTNKEAIKYALIDTLEKAIYYYQHDQKKWQSMQKTAMEQRFEWNLSAKTYIKEYENLIRKK